MLVCSLYTPFRYMARCSNASGAGAVRLCKAHELACTKFQTACYEISLPCSIQRTRRTGTNGSLVRSGVRLVGVVPVRTVGTRVLTLR